MQYVTDVFGSKKAHWKVNNKFQENKPKAEVYGKNIWKYIKEINRPKKEVLKVFFKGKKARSKKELEKDFQEIENKCLSLNLNN